MASALIDGVEIGGHELVFDLGAFAALQKRLGVADLTAALSMFDRPESGGQKAPLDLELLQTFLWAGLLHAQESASEFSEADATRLVQRVPLDDVTAAIMQALIAAFPNQELDQESAEGNARKRPTRKK